MYWVFQGIISHFFFSKISYSTTKILCGSTTKGKKNSVEAAALSFVFVFLPPILEPSACFCMILWKHCFILSQRFSDLSAETAQPDHAGLYSIAVFQPKQWHGSGLVGEEGVSYSSSAKVIHCNYMEGQNVNNVSHIGAHSLSLNLYTL